MTERFLNELKEEVDGKFEMFRDMLDRDTNPSAPGSNQKHIVGNNLELLRSYVNMGNLTQEEASAFRKWFIDKFKLPSDTCQLPWESNEVE